ncbi:tetratricopeptide repeat protein [Aquimarina sp. 2304DJ70-9]|uniref:tetratricopeptide repeat protein n=1 Tax=Aquimarina penaris TaxID=3231044 RepID=UPI003462DE8C
MKDKLKRLLDPNISKEEEDQIFEEVLKRKHDEDLRTKWQEMLYNDHGITRSSANLKNKKQTSKYIKIFLAAAACIALIVTVQLFNTTETDPYMLAQQYLDDQEVLHPGASKGLADEDENRILAIQAFNTKEYSQSIRYFQNIKIPTKEDKYYYGLALLLNNNYTEAVQLFEMINDNDGQFRQEINWYQSLAYLLNKQNIKGEALLKQINNSDWNHQQAQDLIEMINEK